LEPIEGSCEYSKGSKSGVLSVYPPLLTYLTTGLGAHVLHLHRNLVPARVQIEIRYTLEQLRIDHQLKLPVLVIRLRSPLLHLPQRALDARRHVVEPDEKEISQHTHAHGCTSQDYTSAEGPRRQANPVLWVCWGARDVAYVYFLSLTSQPWSTFAVRLREFHSAGKARAYLSNTGWFCTIRRASAIGKMSTRHSMHELTTSAGKEKCSPSEKALQHIRDVLPRSKPLANPRSLCFPPLGNSLLCSTHCSCSRYALHRATEQPLLPIQVKKQGVLHFWRLPSLTARALFLP